MEAGVVTAAITCMLAVVPVLCGQCSCRVDGQYCPRGLPDVTRQANESVRWL